MTCFIAQGCCILLVVCSVFAFQNHEQVLVKFKTGATASQIDSLSRGLGLAKVKFIQEVGVTLFNVTSRLSVGEVVAACEKSNFVEYAEANQTVAAFVSSPSANVTLAASATPVQQATGPATYKAGEVLLKFKNQVQQQGINRVLSQVGIQVIKQLSAVQVYRCRISGTKSVLDAVAQCKSSPDVEYAEPNYIYHTSIVPNDPRFSSLYGMRMIQAPEAWDIQKGSKSVIVGVIDTGIDANHKDLRDNVWRNPGESGNGKENNRVDDDNNGFVDDVQGWDFVNNDNKPFDDNEHGTHVSWSIGAVGNNSEGVAGVSWNVSIMPLKFLDASGSGSTGDAVEAIIYATNLGAKILSNSWGGGGRSQALEDAIQFANDHGVLFVAAAGNEFSNNDQAPTFPANYEIENVISVAASTENNRLAGFSNFGAKTVELAAPGNQILSTVPGDRYALLSGTSMATPHVSGAAALVLSQYPTLTMQQLAVRLLGSVDLSAAYAGKVSTGGRLNVNRALSTNPIIARTTRLENTTDPGPYTVAAEVVDDSQVQTVTLTFQTMGNSAVEINMPRIGDNRYQGEIPTQPDGTTIVYFVSARDDSGNTTRDSNFTFSIAGSGNGGGCGSLRAIGFEIENPVGRATMIGLANVLFFVAPIVLLGRTRKKTKK